MAEQGEVERSRRGLLRAVFGSLAGVGFAALGGVAGLWTAATARFLMPNVTSDASGCLPIGTAADYRRDGVETRFQDRFGVWIVRGTYQGRPQIYALRATCTHLGCMTMWQESERQFKCPCHGSGFDTLGMPHAGPAPRPLERCAIRTTDDGQIEVDRSRTFRQELGQWDDPASFVPG